MNAQILEQVQRSRREQGLSPTVNAQRFLEELAAECAEGEGP